MPIGRVKWFDTNKGYGFIQPDGSAEAVKVLLSAVMSSGLGELLDGQRLRYELEPGYGTTVAVRLEVLEQFRRQPKR